MIQIPYCTMFTAITVLWILLRMLVAYRSRTLSWKREAQLVLVYICIVVVVRFTFCPFGKVNGRIQPLLFDPANYFPFRINLLPFVHLLDYPTKGEILLNLIGNTAMFLPLGIVWPLVFRQLDTHRKVMAAGFGCSLCIELLQLPFFSRVSDIDDLILNTLGFALGYGIYLLVTAIKAHVSRK